MDAPEFGPGWWETEWHAHAPCRWTSGDALLPDLGTCMLEVVLGGTSNYKVDAPNRAEPDVERATIRQHRNR